MSSTFNLSSAIDQSKEKDWPAALGTNLHPYPLTVDSNSRSGMLDWDSTSIVFTKRSLVEFLKYTGTTVDPNFTNIQKLPRYAKFGTLSTPAGASASESTAKEQAQVDVSTDAFKPSRRVRTVPGGPHSNIFGHEEDDDALSSAPRQEERFTQNSTPVATTDDDPAHSEEESGINFSSNVKPSRRVRTVPGGSSSMASLWEPQETVEEFKPTRRVRQGPGGQDHISGLVPGLLPLPPPYPNCDTDRRLSPERCYVLAMSGIPGLGAAVKILESSYQAIDNMNVYKRQCQELRAHCVELLIVLRDSSVGLEGTGHARYADEMTHVIDRVIRKVNYWAGLNKFKSLSRQREIKDGIDSLHRDIDAAMRLFLVQNNLGLARSFRETSNAREHNTEEIAAQQCPRVLHQDFLPPLDSTDQISPEDIYSRPSTSGGGGSYRSLSPLSAVGLGLNNSTVSHEGNGSYSQGTSSSGSSLSPLSSFTSSHVYEPIVSIEEQSGTILGGTLDGLIERLIYSFDQPNSEYQDIFFATYTDFATGEDIVQVIRGRFFAVHQDKNIPPKDRINLQYNVFMVLKRWLTSPRPCISTQLRQKIVTFCQDGLHLITAPTLREKAKQVLQIIDDEARPRPIDRVLSPTNHKFSEMFPLPYDLPLPSPYLRRIGVSNPIEQAYSTNNKIILWVKQLIMRYDGANERAQALTFFINTAVECRKLRNFASLTAIASAVLSSTIERLKHTHSLLSPSLKRELCNLQKIIQPASRHRRYWEGLDQKVEHEPLDKCIPWLPVHLLELRAVFDRNPSEMGINGRRLINFQRCIRLMDRIKDILYYEAPDLEHYRQGQLACLELELKNVDPTVITDDKLEARSVSLAKEEIRIHNTGESALHQLGFKF
ncbi:ras guanine nucleotide exchange factor domain-containing protein [Cyathus striatus]|nr:ras guanine nucleotide exchange factor domain-containing protein [Cyathus striatus]